MSHSEVKNPFFRLASNSILKSFTAMKATRRCLLLFSLIIFGHVSFAFSAGEWMREKENQVEYWIYRPQAVAPSLMISLHGCAQTADDLKSAANWEAAAERFGMTVVLPYVPNGGVYIGCWNFYGRDQTESNKANGPLIRLTEALLKRLDLQIDPNNVFVSGLSSGAAQAMLLGCLRPDLFRGVGLAAGPVVGSAVSDLFGRPQITGAEAAQFCLELAGSRAAFFQKQTTSIIFDEYDSSVNPLHSGMALEAMRLIYGGTLSAIALDLTKLEGLNTNGKGTLLVDAQSRVRLSYIMNAGLGHAWPAGARPSSANGSSRARSSAPYINAKSIDYPAYLGQLFQ